MVESPRSLVESFLSYVRDDARLGVFLVLGALLLAGAALDHALGLLGRRTRLTVPQRQRLALAAPYFEAHGFRRGDLGGQRPSGRLRLRHVLKKDWGIVDAATAAARLDELLRFGHRSDPSFRSPDQSAEERALVERSLLAWDAMRLVFIARCCYTIGYLDAATTWGYADAAARLAAGSFRGWADWGRAFLDGRVLWGGEARSHYETVVDRLQKGSGTWTRVPWESAVQPGSSLAGLTAAAGARPARQA
jgi:hypothetical protein